MIRLAIFLMAVSMAPAAPRTYDVVVYGGTAGGVMAAVSAARQGLRTALVEPTGHVGGMVSGGLGRTDYGRKEVIGGMALEFYWRVGQHYQMGRYGNEIAWLHEPHVAEDIFRQMLRQAHVDLFEHERLAEKEGVRKDGATLAALRMEDGNEFAARVFIDSSYEGDVMAQSGVTYTFGREAEAEYGESLAGVREKTPFHQFLMDIPARDERGRLLPEISAEQPGAPGSADKRVQAYNFRMCLCEAPERQVPFPKPANYNPARYTLLAKLIHAIEAGEHRTPALGRFMNIDRLPNGTTDVNNNGAFSTDYIGGSWKYPDASYAGRQAIWQAHKDYQAGFFYFLAHDPQVPAALRAEMSRWGLCKDEFTDTDNWPRQLYIREARRMVGEYVMLQKDLQTELTKPDPIGMGSYNSDSHNVERIVDGDGFVRNEGDMQVPVKPYQIPYRILLPKRAQASNLLVTAAFSASHVAYSSVRMEPQYMILGQAAGVAAKLAIDGGKPVQDIDTAQLTRTLKAEGAVMEYEPNAQTQALQTARKAGRTEPPAVEISDGTLRAKLYLPDAENGYYRATRFDWSGVIASLNSKDHSYFGQWFEQYDPKLHDSITGPVESFGAIGYDEAPVGGRFLRIGVGWLQKPREPKVNDFHTYEILDSGKWSVRSGKHWVEFTQELPGTYEYKKTVRLVKDQLVLEHSLRNTGETALDTQVFNHDFYMLDNQPTGPDIVVRFPFEVQAQADWRGPGDVRGKEVVYREELPKGTTVSGELKGYGGTAADYDFTVENRKTGARVRQTGDRPIFRIYFWSIRTTVCPEAYIHIHAEPGQAETWRITYQVR